MSLGALTHARRSSAPCSTAPKAPPCSSPCGSIVQAADIMGAATLIPVSFAHIDACFYAGEAHVDFAQLHARPRRAASRVPAWTNNGVVSLADPDLRPEARDPEIVQRRARADAAL